MSKTSSVTLLAAIALLLVVSSPASYPGGRQSDKPPEREAGGERGTAGTDIGIVEPGNAFAFDLFKKTVDMDAPDSNVLISPISVSLALAMAYNGASGLTAEAMAQTLKLNRMPPGEMNESFRKLVTHLAEHDVSLIFKTAQSIWCSREFPVEENFLELNREYFDAMVAELDFRDPASVRVINDWVSANTNGRIENILDEIPPDAVMYLANATWFKGIWSKQFDPALTRDAPFNLADGKQIKCRMMSMAETRHQYYSDSELGFEAVDLPYGDGRFTMTVLLPNEGRSLQGLIGELNNANWKVWESRFRPVELSLQLPRFRLDYGTLLNDPLIALGMGVAFAPGKAEFRGINKEKGDSLFISRVIHKTFVEVNEEGTEAAASTVIEMKLLTAAPQPMVFKVDRPFLFVIRDRESGALLFLGKVMNPLGG